MASLWGCLFSAAGTETVSCKIVVAITPTEIPLTIASGQTGTGEVTLINQGTEKVTLRPRVIALAEGENGQYVQVEEDRVAWVSPEEKVLYLLPSESGSFAFEVQVPARAKPGQYRFALTFELTDMDSAGIGLRGGVAVRIDLEVVEAQKSGGGGGPAWLVVILAAAALLLLGGGLYLIRRRKGQKPAGLGISIEGDEKNEDDEQT